MASYRTYAVERINGQIAILADDEGRQTALPLARLPKGVTKGTVLSIPLDRAGTPAWSAAEIDADEERRRSAEAEKLRQGMKNREPE